MRDDGGNDREQRRTVRRTVHRARPRTLTLVLARWRFGGTGQVL